jgi:hypothetical protein
MRRQTHSPDELRAFIAHEVEEIRNELDQLRSRAEAQQALASGSDQHSQGYIKPPVIEISTR